MKIYNPINFGWRYNQRNAEAVIKKRSQVDFFISIIIAFLIIFIVAQILSYFDQTIRNPLKDKSFSLNPFHVNVAQAGNEEVFKMIQSHREINIVKGVGFTFEVGFKNQRGRTWKQMGASSVDLKLAPPYSRETVVRHKFWRDTQTPAWLKGSSAKAGWLAYYKFALEAPKEAGVYTEKFVLVDYSNGHILSGSEFEITMNVWNDTTEFSKAGTNKTVAKSQSVPSPVVVTKEPPKVEVTEYMYLGRTCLELDIKKFRITTVSQELVDDCMEIGIDLSDNIYEDPVVTTPTVSTTPTITTPTTPSSDSSNGPMIRVGLLNTTEPIIIKANTSYSLKDNSGNVLANLNANQQATINFNFSNKLYTAVANGSTTSTASYLRLEAGNANTVFEIVSLEQRPAWNTSLNDNLFLGNLEIRYSPNTGKLWVINELELERYLKGLAESSNSSPLEYQKALITGARTYAMYHYNRGTKHADEYFTIDSKYDQVYRGYGAQSRLPTVSQAVEQTKGQIVTYNGELAITPYFSHSDGRTRNWTEVWGGTGKPWLVSVTEPQGYDKTTLYGHGVGMSAYGAILLANDYNYSFDKILQYYYTGTSLKKIY